MGQGGLNTQQGDSDPGPGSGGLPGDRQDLLCYRCEGQIHIEAHLGTGLHERQPILLQTAAASLVGTAQAVQPERGHPLATHLAQTHLGQLLTVLPLHHTLLGRVHLTQGSW